MEAEQSLLKVKEVIEEIGDSKARHSYYLEFRRRALILELVERYCPSGSAIVDLGAQPFILSCALKSMGYKVVAVDIDPEPYRKIAEACNVDYVCRCDLERDKVCVGDGEADCAVFSEVLEHLNPYYVAHTMSEVNRVLRRGGILILTTPNIASLFRRLRLLLGMQPQSKSHVHEYTMGEVKELLTTFGFDIVEAFYSEVNDLTYIDAKPEDYLWIKSFKDMLKAVMKRPIKLNMLRVLAYPIVRIVPSTRMLIVIVASKRRKYLESASVERW